MPNLREQYETRYEMLLKPLAIALERHLEALFHDMPRVDRICARAKSVDSFLEKADRQSEDGSAKYEDPLNEIQDQIGARIVTFYEDDVPRISNGVEKYFRPIEGRDIAPESDSSFGYSGKHYIFFIPADVSCQVNWSDELPVFFEFQIKTLFQHAWSEAEHDLGYKPEWELSSDDRRRIAFTAAQAWGADQIFNDLFRKAASQNAKSTECT